MSAIREIMNARRAAAENIQTNAVTVIPEAPTLTIETSNGEICVLPWQHLLYAWYQRDSGGDRLTLTFFPHEVIICGRNFGALVEAVAHLRVGACAAILANTPIQPVATRSSCGWRCGISRMRPRKVESRR